MDWETADRVQRNDAGQLRAFINNEWVPVERAQKNDAGEYRVMRTMGGVPTERKEYVPLAQREAGYQADVQKTLANLFGGAVSGLGNIGATILAPFDIAARKAQELTGVKQIGFGDVNRRAAVQEATRQMLGAEPESTPFKVAQLGGELAAMPPVGKALGAAVKVLPGMQRIVPAIESGGLTAGALTGAAGLGARAVGGAATGGATAALVNPEEVGPGAAAGTAMAFGGPLATRTIGKAAGFVVDALSGNIPKIRAGEIARNVAGENISALRAALQAAPGDINAAQAAYGIHNQGWQALGELAARTDRNSLFLKQQAANRLAELQRNAEAANPTEARAIQEEAVNVLNSLTAQMRATELGAANTAGQVINRLAPQAAQKQASMISALQEGGRAGTEAAQRAEAAAQQLQRVEPGQIPTLSATQAARTQAAASRQFGETADVFNEIAAQRRAEGNFIERQIGSLEAHGLKPLDAQPIVAALDAKISAPGTRASSTQVKVLQALRDDIESLTQKGGGVIDAHDLYTLRKEGLNERIAQLLGPTDPKISSRVTAKILGDVRPMIDEAITKAGGTGWRDYLQTYERGMHGVEQKIMAAQAASLFDKNPQAYVDLVRGKNPDAVEAIFGPGKYDIFKEMASKMPTMEKVAAEVERDAALKEMATGGVHALNEAVEKGSLRARLPNLMNRGAALTNLSLNIVEKKINAKTRDILSEGMASGKSMLEILDTIPASERIKVLRVLTNPASWGARPTQAAAAKAAEPKNALAPESETQNALAQ